MLRDNNKCFACGQNNPDGLQLQFTYCEDEAGLKAETRFVPPAAYQGWESVVHGGILATLLDEVMAKAALNRGYTVLTAEISVRFKNTAAVLEPLLCEGRITSVKKNVLYAGGTIFRQDGTIVASATAKMMITSTAT